MKFSSHILKITDINDNSIDQMFSLMQAHYDNVSKDEFIRDLSEKDCVILLKDIDGIKGFSTQMMFEHTVDGKTVKVVFSGDTIIDRSCWGTLALPVAFGKMMLDLKGQHEEQDLYWFLISKGYRTYRFLSTFFKTYYPNISGMEDKFEKQLLREVAKTKFGSSFDCETCVINASPTSQKVKTGICDITNQRRKNKHIAFYEKRNPGFADGDELACIARFDRNNLTSFILKRITEEFTRGVLM